MSAAESRKHASPIARYVLVIKITTTNHQILTLILFFLHTNRYISRSKRRKFVFARRIVRLIITPARKSVLKDASFYHLVRNNESSSITYTVQYFYFSMMPFTRRGLDNIYNAQTLTTMSLPMLREEHLSLDWYRKGTPSRWDWVGEAAHLHFSSAVPSYL